MATHTHIDGSDAKKLRQTQQAKKACLETVPADNFIVGEDMPPILILTPAGAIDILMPAAAVNLFGLTFEIYNQGAGGIITLKTSADAAFSPAITIAVNTGRKVVCNGTTWRQVL